MVKMAGVMFFIYLFYFILFFICLCFISSMVLAHSQISHSSISHTFLLWEFLSIQVRLILWSLSCGILERPKGSLHAPSGPSCGGFCSSSLGTIYDLCPLGPDTLWRPQCCVVLCGCIDKLNHWVWFNHNSAVNKFIQDTAGKSLGTSISPKDNM